MTVAIQLESQYVDCMPYFFPYEDLFLYTIATLIAGLLFLRVRLARKRRKLPTGQDVEQRPS
jgi:hypothetical protein